MLYFCFLVEDFKAIFKLNSIQTLFNDLWNELYFVSPNLCCVPCYAFCYKIFDGLQWFLLNGNWLKLHELFKNPLLTHLLTSRLCATSCAPFFRFSFRLHFCFSLLFFAQKWHFLRNIMPIKMCIWRAVDLLCKINKRK